MDKDLRVMTAQMLGFDASFAQDPLITQHDRISCSHVNRMFETTPLTPVYTDDESLLSMFGMVSPATDASNEYFQCISSVVSRAGVDCLGVVDESFPHSDEAGPRFPPLKPTHVPLSPTSESSSYRTVATPAQTARQRSNMETFHRQTRAAAKRRKRNRSSATSHLSDQIEALEAVNARLKNEVRCTYNIYCMLQQMALRHIPRGSSGNPAEGCSCISIHEYNAQALQYPISLPELESFVPSEGAMA